MREWNGLQLKIEAPKGWTNVEDPNATVFESASGLELRITPLELPSTLIDAVNEKSLATWGLWSAERMGLLNPTEQRTGPCRFGLYATFVFENPNAGELPRAQLWFVADQDQALFITLVGAAKPDELSTVQQVIDTVQLRPIEKASSR